MQSCANNNKSIRLRLKIIYNNRLNKFVIKKIILIIKRNP